MKRAGKNDREGSNVNASFWPLHSTNDGGRYRTVFHFHRLKSTRFAPRQESSRCGSTVGWTPYTVGTVRVTTGCGSVAVGASKCICTKAEADNVQHVYVPKNDKRINMAKV